MNILVINGSPKGDRSNTLRLTNAFLDGLCGQDDHEKSEIHRLSVNQLVIKPCLGCFACWSKTPGKCCLGDDMQQVIQELLWADVTVWSFPLYYFGIPGPMKNLIDRQLPMNLPFMAGQGEGGGHPSRYDLSGKRHVLISTCGFYTAKGNYDSVTAMFDRFCGKGNYTAIFCGQGELFRVRELSARTEEYLAVVRKAGSEYLDGIRRDTMDILNQPLFPRDVFEAMADASWGVSETGEKQEESLIFTRQMAALYNKSAYPGKDIILDMDYTDIGKTYRIILTKEGSRVTEDFSGPCTTCIHTPYTVWCSIAAGEISGSDAMMKRMYTVEGDFDLMIHWGDYFGGTQAAVPDNEKKSVLTKTHMNQLLIPWIVFWVGAPIHGFWGSLISVGVCVLLPLFFFRYRRTVYDLITAPAVTCCALALLLGAPRGIVVPVSYFLFGVLWSVSCFCRIPLTAHYSMNDYGGEEAWDNAVFMRTNRILTAAWGVLYLLTPIWTFFLMKTEAGSYLGAVNSILPMIMGFFTDWFQKWYPKHIAGGK